MYFSNYCIIVINQSKVDGAQIFFVCHFFVIYHPFSIYRGGGGSKRGVQWETSQPSLLYTNSNFSKFWFLLIINLHFIRKG